MTSASTRSATTFSQRKQAKFSVDIARIRENLLSVFDSNFFGALSSGNVLNQMPLPASLLGPLQEEKPPFQRFTGTVFPFL
jgi:hypothetical protein